MTPPNITKGEWTVAAESGQWWVTDQDYQELPETEENARFLAASKAMAEALEKWLLVESEHRENNPCPDLMLRATYRKDAIKATHYALLLAGYTE